MAETASWVGGCNLTTGIYLWLGRVRPFASCQCAAANVCNAKSPKAINAAQELTREMAKPWNMLKALDQYAKNSSGKLKIGSHAQLNPVQS